jgi:hypothetical protein
MKYLVIAITLVLSTFGFSYNEDFGKSKATVKQNKAGCAPSNAYLNMNYNDVSARLETGGILFLDRQNGRPTYEVPKGSGNTVIYAASLWMGGVDGNGQLKIAAQKFRDAGNDFWPGPLSSLNGQPGNYDPSKPVGDNATRDFGDATIGPTDCVAYDKFFTIKKSEVVQFITWWNCNNVTPKPEGCSGLESPSNEVLQRIYAWPAHGNVSSGQDRYLAPFYDNQTKDGHVVKNGQYNPLTDGDYPWYDDILGKDDIVCGSDRRISLFGDITHWWIFNDKGNIHTETGGDPIGMEIRAQAFCFLTNDQVNSMTFYNYELINKGSQTLYNTYFSQYVDCDLGGAPDDYVGCDVTRGLGYCFNGDSYDDDYRIQKGYGANPPAIGVDFFEGPYQDADEKDNPGPVVDEKTGKITVPTVVDAIQNKGIVYAGLGIGYGDGIIDNERFGMKRFSYYSLGAPQGQSDPTSSAQFYNYMNGKWRFGERMVYGGSGFPNSKGSTTTFSDYMFPGDSDTLNWGTAGTDPGFKDWSEKTNDNKPQDRRFVQSAGPFTLRPGAVNNITVGVVYARSAEGDLFASVRALKRADTKAQALFDNCFKILDPPNAPRLTVQELDKGVVLTLDNPSSSNNYQEKYIEKDVNIDPTVQDRYYRFEGYMIYQLKGSSNSVSDINDLDKARLVAQADIKNGVSRIINFEFDEGLGYSVPVEKVSGGNSGIKHSFLITEDKFAQGNARLVNNKKYYYVAVAYAHNSYKKYDPSDATSLDGQKIPFIASRNSFDGSQIIPALVIPHKLEVEKVQANSTYETSPEITRLDGRGNGGRDLELTSNSKDIILKEGFYKTPTYTKGKGPLNIKVVDPLNLKGGYFTCKFDKYVSDTNKFYSNFNGKNIDTSSWTIYRYSKEGGQLLDSVKSEQTISVDNEQIIADWGISVQINQKQYYFATASYTEEYKRYTDPISSSITYADSSKKWLSFVTDDNTFTPNNWIRSGDYEPADSDNDPSEGFNNPYLFFDQKGADPDKKYTKLLGGGIAPHCLVGYQSDYMPIAYPAFFSKSKYIDAREKASLTRIPSVDIVITSDTSKWTRCAVVELGRQPGMTEGGAIQGTLRKGPSVDKKGNTIVGSTGMGWFPGYAIDIESGMRLHMAFGENSILTSENGRDMIWNPTSVEYDASGSPRLGGQHAIYVFGYNVHGYNAPNTGRNCPYYDGVNNWVYDKLNKSTSPNNFDEYSDAYHSLLWVVNPLLAANSTVLSTDVTLRVRVNKEYTDFDATEVNNGKPMYGWSMDGIASEVASQDTKVAALALINVVPNPYYAFSAYESTSDNSRHQLDNRVKITNLPEVCTIKIYNISGKLIRTYKKDNSLYYQDWDLKNNQAIPIASGIYLIHVDVPGVGSTVVKFFGGMRQVDLENI